MTEQPGTQSNSHSIALAQRNISGLLGIADWMEESGQPRKANALRTHAQQLDELLGEWASEQERERVAGP
jgi:hypothetical protein